MYILDIIFAKYPVIICTFCSFFWKYLKTLPFIKLYILNSHIVRYFRYHQANTPGIQHVSLSAAYIHYYYWILSLRRKIFFSKCYFQSKVPSKNFAWNKNLCIFLQPIGKERNNFLKCGKNKKKTEKTLIPEDKAKRQMWTAEGRKIKCVFQP